MEIAREPVRGDDQEMRVEGEAVSSSSGHRGADRGNGNEDADMINGLMNIGLEEEVAEWLINDFEQAW